MFDFWEGSGSPASTTGSWDELHAAFMALAREGVCIESIYEIGVRYPGGSV